MLSHHVVYLLVLGTCSNFAAKRALSTEQLFPIKLRLKSFLYLSLELQDTGTARV